MVGGNGVWGIDIGQCGIKALRGTLGPGGATIVAQSFDYLEYPKILSQPDAKPDQLVRDALKQFLSRNSLRGDRVAISISGQSGLARFIKLPPVESKKIPDIVKYEAKQQIPFALEDVIWDYQQMPGATEEEGYALSTEVGLFAMKRDQVFRAIRPLIDAEVELDIIQLTPLCIYNAVAFDQLLDEDAVFEDDKLPESVVIVSLGTETSDLVVTNGFRVWQRSIPLGGNHFTKQLTKELKLTFAKAEHIKRNARDVENAKNVIQAMRPVYNDLVTEVQRSVGYFRSLERGTELTRMIVLGNATKLPGLPKYLSKNLDMQVIKLDKFKKLSGAEVIDAPAFKDNVLAFPVSYGLVVQGLGKAQVSTNLVPREIVRQRLIRQKKPWAAAVAAAVLLGCAFSFFFHWRGWNSVHQDYRVSGIAWSDAQSQANSIQTQSTGLNAADAEQLATLSRLYELGDATVGSADGRLLWPELLKMITEALPIDDKLQPGEIKTIKERELDGRPELYIESIKSEYFADLSTWLTDDVRSKYEAEMRALRAAEAGRPPAEGGETEEANESASLANEDITVELPTLQGSGLVIEIHGRHFHNDDVPNIRANYVRGTLISKLADGSVELPLGPGQGTATFTARELGILYPLIVREGRDTNFSIPNPNAAPKRDTKAGQSGASALGRPAVTRNTRAAPSVYESKKPPHKFVVQFAWQQKQLSQRLDERAQKNNVADAVASTPSQGR